VAVIWAGGCGALAASPAPKPAPKPALRVDPAVCRQLVEAPDDGTVAYRPGVDVQGRAVVPAEGPGGESYDWLPDPLRIELSVPLAKKLGLGDDATNYEADGLLGTLTLRDGQAYLDGKPITNSLLPEVQAACRRLKAGR
jgi:hypothetical protein